MRSPVGGGRRTYTLSGLWIAAIGFFVTRFTVALAAFDDRVQFLVAGVVPLVLGLSLAAFGVAMLVGGAERSFVRSVAVWCTAGTAAMAVLVAITLVATDPAGPGSTAPIRSDVVLANFMIGGAVLGALTGLFAGANRRHRDQLRRQANRMVTINRILRHEVLNAIGIIRGQAEALDDPAIQQDPSGALDPIVRESDRIADTIEDVKHLARSSSAGLSRVDLGSAVAECVEAVRREHPDVAVEFGWDDDESVDVWADSQLTTALYHLVENAAAYDDSAEPRVDVEVAVGRRVACVRIADDGPGLPEAQRATLERGSITDFDDPGAGFGTHVARLFVEGYGGNIRTEVTDDGTTVEVELRLGSEDRPTPSGSRSVGAVGLDRADLLVAFGASIVAGAVMGLYVQWAAGVIPVIGALYGVSDPLVGWITHEFHSVVFGLVFVSFLVLLQADGEGDRLLTRVAVAVAWSLALWIVAAGVIMPVWLNLVGVPAPIPNVSSASFVGHLLWGVTLGGAYHLGTRALARRRNA